MSSINNHKILLKKPKANKNKKRVARGIAANQGMTAGRGTKGQRSRSGFNLPNRFEGGQTPLSMRLPKLRGFKKKKNEVKVISLDTISKYFKTNEVVSSDSLIKKGVIRKGQVVKILNTGELKHKVIIKDVKISKSANKVILSFDKS